MKRFVLFFSAAIAISLLAAAAALAHHKPGHEGGNPAPAAGGAGDTGAQAGAQGAGQGKAGGQGQGKSGGKGAGAGGGGGTGNTAGAGNSINQGRHTICHATGSESNPFVVITPAKAGVFNGHLGGGHQDGEDIIPPFQYDSDRDGTFETYSQNWGAEGQAIFNNGCERPEAAGGAGDVNPGGGGGGGQPSGGPQAGGVSAGGAAAPQGGPAAGVAGVQAGGVQAAGGVKGVQAGGVKRAQALQGELPFTGLPLWIPLLAAAGLLAGGLGLRWVARSR